LRLDWIVPARYAENSADGTMVLLGAGSDTLWIPVDQMPAQVALFLALRIAGPEDEWQEGGHSLAIALRRPDGEETEGLRLDLKMDELPPLRVPGQEPSLLLSSPQQWTAQDFGLYTFEIYIDDRRAKSLAIHVRDAADLEQEPS
jgi:hypothetical protein